MPSFDTTNKTNDTVIELLQVINVLVAELQPNRPTKAITLDTSFEKDLGLDSLTRVDLIQGRNRTGTSVRTRDFKFSESFFRVITFDYY